MAANNRTIELETEIPTWPIERLQAYINCVRSRFESKLQPDSEKVLMAYYQRQRAADSRNAGALFFLVRLSPVEVIYWIASARTTIRMLESLIRLAQGM